MELRRGMLVAIHSANDRKIGRTLLQKITFFANDLGAVDVEFYPHYYGPFSDVLYDATESLLSLNLIKEEKGTIVEQRTSCPTPVEKTWYSYSLTKDGRGVIDNIIEEFPEDSDIIIDIVKKSIEILDFKSQSMACASKVLYILDIEDSELSDDEIKNIASDLGWKLTQEEIDKITEFLVRLELIST